MIRSLVIAPVVDWFHLASLPAVAQSGDAGRQAIHNEVWELRAKGKDGEANRLNGRLRPLGCFEPPISDSLGSILEHQEILRQSEGSDALASVLRAQQRRFLCF